MSHVFAQMSGYTPQGVLADGQRYRICYCLDQGVKEVRVRFPNITSVGVLGDQRHQEQKNRSAHNALISAPDGFKLVTATDLVGPQADLDQLQQLIEKRYNANDPRQWPFGFTQMNGQGTVWDNDPHTILHYTGADYGHLHWNINTVNFPILDEYKSFMDDTSPWGIADAVESGSGGASSPITTDPITTEEEEEVPYIIYVVNKPTLVAVVHPSGRVNQTIDNTYASGLVKAGAKRVPCTLATFNAELKRGAK